MELLLLCLDQATFMAHTYVGEYRTPAWRLRGSLSSGSSAGLHGGTKAADIAY